MATITIKTPPRQIPDLSNHTIDVPPPDPLPEQKKGPLMMRIVPLFIVGMMLLFVVMMFATGSGQMSPRMLMMPMGMMMMSLAYLGVGGQGGGSMSDLDTSRSNYQLKLREQRTIAHHVGEGIHRLHTMTYPHPLKLAARAGMPGMWSIRPSDSKLPPTGKEQDTPEALQAWLTCRVGVGVTRLLPTIVEPATEIPARLEPVTAGAFRRFLRTQKFITNCPLGISLAEQEAYSFRGDPTATQEAAAKSIMHTVALGRAMICSLAYNHSPNDLAIGIICDADVRGRWDWMKWLPNNQDPRRHDQAGSARYAWGSVAEFVADSGLSARDGSHLVVFIDTPNNDVSLPPGWTRAQTTFVVLNAPSESLTTKQGRFHVSANREFSTLRQLRLAHTDSLTVVQARVLAQKMSRYRPPNWNRDDRGSEVEVSGTKQSYFDVLGITDIETWDPRPRWEANSVDSHFEIPVGFVHDGRSVTSEVFTMDFAEASLRGTGPHGVIQGMTGSGKSFLLMGLVGSLCSTFGPDKINLILMDFKGGTAFRRFDRMPHVTANISNLDNAADLVARTGVVLEGEIRRRELLMDEYDCKDIVEYRKKRAKNPDKYPVLPELFVIMDEFREYMQMNPDVLRVFIRIGTVGRGWGIHVWPCSQVVDMTLLRDLQNHITFGISLRASDSGSSRGVIGTDEAASLPMGEGQAIALRKTRKNPDDPERVRFQGFDVEQAYIAPARQALKRHDAGKSGADRKDRLSDFTLENAFSRDEAAEADLSSEHDVVVEDLDDLPKMKDALIDRIGQFQEIKALQLWQPTLRAPISYADVKVASAVSPRLEFEIGITDAPFEHARVPYVIRPEDSGAHVRIVGQAGSGRSTAVEAMICSAAQAYSPQFCSFYVIDYGAKLSEMEAMPNVGGYARKTDEDSINRFLGEFFRVLEIREREFGRRRVSTLDEYFADRAQSPTEGDPYGHMFLVFDGFPGYLADNEGAKETLPLLLEGGTRYGLHVVVTALANAEIPMKMHRFFGTTIHLAVQDPNESFVMGQAKAMVQALPSDQPGRCIDFGRMLEARILVPQFEEIEAIGEEKGMPKYDNRANYSAGISRFVDAMQARYAQPEQRAVPIRPAPPRIDYQIIWDLYDGYAKQIAASTPQVAGRRTSLDKHLPFAISTEDLRVITVPDHTSPHLLAVGDTKSGKTTLLRALINSVVGQFTKDEAQIVIIESRYDLLAEQEKLGEAGYLMAYADKNSLPDAIAKIKEAIAPRFPSLEQGEKLSAEAVRNRSWYTGPEVFVLIDNVLSFTGGGFSASSPFDPMLELMTRDDVGLHVYATGSAQGFGGMRLTNKVYKALGEANTATVMLSGPAAEGTIWPNSGIKFALRRPGQAAIVDPTNMKPEVVQIGLARPWDEDNAQR
ncbi:MULTISPECIES: FtsK/SpoIIIE domain-containing protein [Mycolicibacter]|uniref:FtsK/SpoIIIE domain-containing protein n=2 Tax=Mycolicibacter TaxID=1073531 RepID=A0ABU5XL08_9MYCO|nr:MULTISPECIES: FtsK/SpoIIIE domain-containing protein [unclassified Mycolicibacter]MEB3022942.1 FtsK/SpoIIIE domain-containing protein [Mycolicibacter sp. MYC098]MEB3035071.1 FtsK/SpoIIIE domain-containing protein [Mycolicibacter sp. MYC340]